MIITGRDKVHEFTAKHQAAGKSLQSWIKILETSAYKHLVDLKKTFPSADYLRPYTIFDIGGNKYRVIALIDYEARVVLIKAAMTHEEYDRGKWKRGGG